MSRRNNDRLEEDPLANDAGEDEPSDAEDLFGNNMADDYNLDPELDQYDPELIDDEVHAPMTVDQRLAAEREMALRDSRHRKRQRNAMDMSPGASSIGGLLGSSPGGLSSSLDMTPDTRPRRMRRTGAESATPGSPGTPGDDGFSAADAGRGAAFGLDDQDVPEYQYDLTRDILTAGMEVDKRLEQKNSPIVSAVPAEICAARCQRAALSRSPQKDGGGAREALGGRLHASPAMESCARRLDR